MAVSETPECGMRQTPIDRFGPESRVGVAGRSRGSESRVGPAGCCALAAGRAWLACARSHPRVAQVHDLVRGREGEARRAGRIHNSWLILRVHGPTEQPRRRRRRPRLLSDWPSQETWMPQPMDAEPLPNPRNCHWAKSSFRYMDAQLTVMPSIGKKGISAG